MVRCILNIIGVITAIVGVGVEFTKENHQLESIQSGQVYTYFKFIGIPGVNENDPEKWEAITQALHDDDGLFSPLACRGTHKGCKLKSTATQTINGVIRPLNVYVVFDYSISPGHFDPIVGSTVVGIKNMCN